MMLTPFVKRLLLLWALAVETFLIVMAVIAGFDSKKEVAGACAMGALVWFAAFGMAAMFASAPEFQPDEEE